MLGLGAALTACSDGGVTLPGTGMPPGDSDGPPDVETVPSQGEPWRRDAVRSPGPILFTELHYHDPTDEGLEWIELFNPLALDLLLTGWTLGGGVHYAFTEGTVLPAGGFLVVAADPALLDQETGFSDAVGPYEGRLDNGGERLELISSSGRRIDSVAYGDDHPWPVHPDGSGWTLAKRDLDAASDHAEHWTVSAEPGGSPGEPNDLDPLALPSAVVLVPDDANWRYDASGAPPADDWTEADYDDGGWESAHAPLTAGAAETEVAATAWVTADNYYALYLGHVDGSDLRLVAEDRDGDWTTVESVALDVGPRDHLYLAAWEAPGDSTSPQMTIAEVALPDEDFGTGASDFEWVLGPPDANPGMSPPGLPPGEAALADLIADAEGSWSVPAVDADRNTSPWGGTVGSVFTDAARFVWGDTFDYDSVTNQQETYALFRSVTPLLEPQEELGLEEIPTAVWFRTDFSWSGDAASTELRLECVIDDGAVVFLNGVEVLRENLPEGALDEQTLATSSVEDAQEVYAEFSGDALVQGENLLAVAVYQAEPDDLDLAFGCGLTAVTWPGSDDVPVLLNEVASVTEGSWWAEVLALSTHATETLKLMTSDGQEVGLPEGQLVAGDRLLVDDVLLDLGSGDGVFLVSADGATLFDAVRVGADPRAREDGGRWLFPAEVTPGEENVFALTEDVVLNELSYNPSGVSPEWIELYNRGAEEVDLGGWQLVDAVGYVIPSGTVLGPGRFLVIASDAGALQAEYPDATVVGDFVGRLDNPSDRVLLLDAVGNPADTVRYFDGGSWPAAADGGGATLELLDPWADNAVGGAWAASDEGERTAWSWYSIRGQAEASAVGPDGQWEEFLLGLLDAGEILVDDVSLVVDPDTTSRELLQDGSFESGGDAWRLLGNHRHSELVPDPEEASNTVLRLVATGPTGHMHNHIETTLVEPIANREHELTFRARWVSGSNQLHSRLYFNRLPRTTLVSRPDLAGTPGAENGTARDDLGPTLSGLSQDVAVPAPGEAVTVSVSAADPDGVAGVTLWSSVAGGPFEASEMVERAPGLWEADLLGRAAGTLVQIYVEAEDSRGGTSELPAGGSGSRALVGWDDALAEGGLHGLRILMTESDVDWLHDDVNLMSNDAVGATVISDEAEVFYDVGVRVKGSQRGRPQSVRLGYGLGFHGEQPFRGSHSSVLIDRSEGVGYGQREVLHNLVMTHAGAVSGEHSDLVQLVAPLPEISGPAELQLDRFTGVVLDAQFEDGSAGGLFEYELIYYPLTTEDGTSEGLKLPQPDSVIGTAITDLGDDAEDYRWNFLNKRNEREDDYAPILDLCQTFALSGTRFLDQVDEVIDVDQWLRAFAFATLSGATDQYGGAGSQHNAQVYVRPADGRVLYFPHDLDYFGSSSMAVIGNGDLARLLDEPAWSRAYYGHLVDILTRSYSAEHLAPWCDQLGELLPGQDFDAHCAFVEDRANWVWRDSPDAVLAHFPAREFRITTGGGGDLTVSAAEVLLEGEAWVDVRTVTVDGAAEALALTWTDEVTWEGVVLLEPGGNDLVLVARDLQGQEVGRDTVTVTSGAESR